MVVYVIRNYEEQLIIMIRNYQNKYDTSWYCACDHGVTFREKYNIGIYCA